MQLLPKSLKEAVAGTYGYSQQLVHVQCANIYVVD